MSRFEMGPRIEKGEHDPVSASWEAMKKTIEDLKNNSRFKYEKEGDRVFIIAESGEKFELQKIVHKEHKETRKVASEIRRFMGKFFEEEENDSVNDYATAIREKLGDFLLARDSKGEIAAAINTQLSEVGEGIKSAELIVWYVATDPRQQGKGIATELYKNTYEAALDQVQKGPFPLEFKAIVEEADPAAEGYFNKLGRKRVYFENQRTGNFEELLYMAPPSETDEDPSLEHLMVRFLDDHVISNKEEVLKLIRGIYNQYLRPQYFESMSKKEGLEYRAKVESVFDGIVQVLEKAKDGRVYLWSKEEREAKAVKLKKSGKKIIELETE